MLNGLSKMHSQIHSLKTLRQLFLSVAHYKTVKLAVKELIKGTHCSGVVDCIT